MGHDGAGDLEPADLEVAAVARGTSMWPGNMSRPIGNTGGLIAARSTSQAVRPSCSDGAYTTRWVSSWSSGPKNGRPCT